MLRQALMGAAAGAVGSAALNIASYADMAIRGRAASNVPGDLAGTLAETVGLDLATAGDRETAENRKTGIGALLGYVTGLSIGAAYGLLQPSLRDVPLPLAGVGVGVAAMAMSDVPATVAGVTDPATWGAIGWGMDFAFHVVYGLATVIAYDAFMSD